MTFIILDQCGWIFKCLTICIYPTYFIDPIASEQDPRGDMIVLAEEWMAEKAWEVISNP